MSPSLLRPWPAPAKDIGKTENRVWDGLPVIQAKQVEK
jgi:hypothetical protein